MITFESLRYKNFLSTGNTFTTIPLSGNKTNLIVGKNGSGKCFCINTSIRVRNILTGEIYSTTIGELYAVQKKPISD